MALSLLGIAARLVLFDRWSATGNLAAMIPQTTGLDVIGTVNASPHVYYEFAKDHLVEHRSVPDDEVVRIYGKRCLGHRDGL
ncbi:MAG: hypothetical protein M1600_09470 [Firmicutes bacterium]|nr:hypothetical protein [Bacillota bacterium]